MKRRRSDTRRGTAPVFARTLAKSEIVGTWEWDPATGHFLLDEGAAERMAGDVRLAGLPLRSERATAGLGTAEAARFLGDVGRAAEQEDDVAVDLWVASATGPARKVLCRGRIHRDARRQPVRGEGTLVERADPGAGTRSLRELKRAAAAEAIDEAAELLIAARRAIDASGKPRLRQLIDVLLLEVGREIANHSGATESPSH
ncbi:hypothetical protein [Methylorubrum podarium]|uniref:Uncharacterized protein n=1 Tax=Methylorubrum podarium TaxID=200476 RepID=A0ABV1QT16_9HYPH|nr:hypothetical protein [Methylorubrum podarium]GJE70724.1 hypothetical protein CHKEEEPN_2265 [Methylorubrum podarium]